jgi:tagaturonate reductase
MPILSKEYLLSQNPVYRESMYPIKIIQFGTGVLLRGLVDDIFQEAKDQYGWNGSIAVVKSTSGGVSDFIAQDYLYTLLVAGLQENGQAQVDKKIIDIISAVWTVQSDWQAIETCFSSDALDLVVSNVTEVGLVYDPNSNEQPIPDSFPAKLTRLLFKRYQNIRYEKKIWIIPCELIPQNGQILKTLVYRHAQEMNLEPEFITWLDSQAMFLNSLVDRIVPGKIGPGADKHLSLPYEDKLAIQAESYRLWAIEGNSEIKNYFHFSPSLKGLVIQEDILAFREQKLRLLNGGHTLIVPIAFALGHRSVYDMMQNPKVLELIHLFCVQEIIPTLHGIAPEAEEFYTHMLMRWKNPFIIHHLHSILFQCTTKIAARYLESIQRYQKAYSRWPAGLTFALTAFLFLWRPKKNTIGKYVVLFDPKNELEIEDQKADLLAAHWAPYHDGAESDTRLIIRAILQDNRVFNYTFVSNEDFLEKIDFYVAQIQQKGLVFSLDLLLTEKK